jgi:hypothetical protein
MAILDNILVHIRHPFAWLVSFFAGQEQRLPELVPSYRRDAHFKGIEG